MVSLLRLSAKALAPRVVFLASIRLCIGARCICPLLAAHALLLRCAASAVLSSTLWCHCKIARVVTAEWRVVALYAPVGSKYDAVPHPGHWGAAPVAHQARSALWPSPGVRAGLPVCRISVVGS
jgi:hypothetical protein